MNLQTSTQAGANGLDTAASESAVDRAFGDNAIDALLSQIVARDDTETVEDEAEATETEQIASEDSEEEADETSVTKPETSRNGKSGDGTETSKGKLPGMDVVLRTLDRENPAFADVVRKLQGEYSKLTGGEADLGKRLEDAKSLQNQLRDALEEVKSIRDQEEQEPTKVPSLEELLPNVPESQREAFRAAFEVMKTQMGLVSRDELQSDADRKAQAEYLKSLYTDHTKKHGEQFGTINNKGELIISPELKPKLEAVRERLSSGRQGVTWADLHILAAHDDIVKAAEEKAVADYRELLKTKTDTKIAALKKGRTVDGSTSQGGTRFARTKGESAKQTYDRAFDLAWSTSVSGR